MMKSIFCFALISLPAALLVAEPVGPPDWIPPVAMTLLENAKSPLIPFPREVTWGGGDWSPAADLRVVYPGDQASMLGGALKSLKTAFAAHSITLTDSVAEGPVVRKPRELEISIVPDVVSGAEGYQMEVRADGVSIRGVDAAGAFYGVQTLLQMLRPGKAGPLVQQATIRDGPAFGLRGFMHDTGRNFQSLESLKEQIEIFAAYKLNVFHWHLTDNPAWRIECRVYPQLNDPKHQTRDKGRIYSYEQILELIRYARERQVTVIPELDMPGHSAFFDRAFGFGMGSDKGMEVLEKLIAEFCQEIPAADCPYLHIGSDEVHIPNPQAFIDRMLKAVRSHGRKPLVWSPGLKADDGTIEQLWADEGSGSGRRKTAAPFVDSGGGYLNALDPLQLVMKYFFRQPAHQPAGDDKALGGILCCWPDVYVEDKTNIFRHNPVWPGMLAFSESIWGGRPVDAPQHSAVQPMENSVAGKHFREFGSRLAAHRDGYFAKLPFPFVKTSRIPWRIAGPFERAQGVATDTGFEPEKSIQPNYTVGGRTISWQETRGGTVVLRDRDGQGVMPHKGPPATAYALTYIHAQQAGTTHAWIGFETPARSNRQCAGIPPVGKWDAFGGQVWINDAPLPAPKWKQPGKYQYLKPTWFAPANEIPYTDEEFYWTREPAEIHLRAGWNKVLLRVPRGYDAQSWSFTFIPVKRAGDRWIEEEGPRFSTDPDGSR